MHQAMCWIVKNPFHSTPTMRRHELVEVEENVERSTIVSKRTNELYNL